VHDEPVLEQAEPGPVAAIAEDTFPTEPMYEGEASEPVEAPVSVLEMRVDEPTTAETAARSEIEEQISTQEWSPEPEPERIEQDQSVPYQITVTAEEPLQSEAVQEPEIAEVAGAGRAITEDTVPAEPLCEGKAFEPVEAPASVLKMGVTEPTSAETAAPSEIEEQISAQEWSPQPEPDPIEQGQPVPYQTVMTAEEPAEIAVPEQPEIGIAAEIAGVSGAIAGISALPEASEIPRVSDEEHFAPQPTPIETMPETLQTPTAPAIRTSGAPTQPAHTAPAPQAAAGGMHTAVQITLSCEIASMQLTPTFKMGALQLRPISKVVTMRLASSPPPEQQQEAAMNLQANFEIAKIQSGPGSLGQLRLNPSQQQRPATLATPSFNISGMQLVSGFDSAPLQLTPSHQTKTSVHLTAAFQITSVEFSPAFEIAGIILNSSSKTVAVQLPGAGASSVENAPMFEITNVQMGSNGEIAMLQLHPVAKRG
jgi:hypothetical protein